jgi:glutamate 5-kinase
MTYRRVVIKLGTNLLTAGSDRLNLETMASLVGQIAALHKQGLELVIVSSGAVAAGRHRLGPIREGKGIPFKQVLAAVGQSRLMDAYDQLLGWHEITIAQALLTRTDLTDRHGYLNAHSTLSALLELRVVPIVNENDVVAVDEIQEAIFGDNDNLSAMVANLINADLLMLLTDTAGLYCANPHADPDAKLVERVEKIDAAIECLATTSHSERSTGGMVTKIEAAKFATTSGVAVVIADGREPNVIVRLANGESIGTYFQPLTTRLESRKRWLLSQPSRGKLFVDTGAARALKEQNKSLLPAGITGVQGKFERGDIADVSDAGSGEKIACGISNYSSADIEAIKGAHSDRIADVLGHDNGSEVIHRDNLIML